MNGRDTVEQQTQFQIARQDLYEEFLKARGVTSIVQFVSSLNRAARLLQQNISPALIPSSDAVEDVVARMRIGNYKAEKFGPETNALRRYGEMVEENFRDSFESQKHATVSDVSGGKLPLGTVNMPPQAHPGFEHSRLFHEFCLAHGVASAAYHYSTCMSRMARILGLQLGPGNVRSEADVQAISAQLRIPSLNDRQRSNFQSVLRKYVEMVRSNFKGKFDAFVAPAIDVGADPLPPRVWLEVSRVVRDTALANELKRAYAGQCQVCRGRLELAPGEFYVEAHHLKPLGQPHNGPDVKENIVCVCPNCHVLLDYGALPIKAKTLQLNLHAVGKEFISYHNDRCR